MSIKKINFRVYRVKELISQSSFSTDDILEKIPKLWTPPFSLLSLNENILTKDIYGTTSSRGSRALQGLVDILNAKDSSLHLECMKYSFSKENPAFIYIADRVLSKLCNCVMLDQMSYKKSLK